MRLFTVPEGMARSVWENKYARKTDAGFQTWSERLTEVVNGKRLLLSPKWESCLFRDDIFSMGI